MGFFANSAALWSFLGLTIGLVVAVLLFVYLYYCYFPGGYKKEELMDMGEYAMFVAQRKHEERRKKVEEKEADEYLHQYDELYYPAQASRGAGGEGSSDWEYEEDEEVYRSGTGRRGRDWQSEAASEADVEGGGSYYYESSSSPSASVYSKSHYTSDGQSTMSPSSQATPSQQRTLKPALKQPRDDRSESTYASGSSSYSRF